MRQAGRPRLGPTAKAAAAAVALTVALAGCGDGDPDATEPTTTPSASPSPDDTGTPVEEPSPVETVSETAAVWYVVDSRAGLRLVREYRELVGEDVAVAAVEAMVAGAQDPDYTSTWNPDTEVLSVEQDGSEVVVDLSEEARTANVGSEGAAMMVQQLVHTVTDAVDPEAGVVLLVEGEPAGELWGAVTWDAPQRRAEALDVRLLVQIDSPSEGGTLTSPVTIEGEAASFEATVPWRVLDAAGAEVESGAATAEEGMRMSPFSFQVELEPGSYLVEVREDDPSGGEGGEPMSDTRMFVVE